MRDVKVLSKRKIWKVNFFLMWTIFWWSLLYITFNHFINYNKIINWHSLLLQSSPVRVEPSPRLRSLIFFITLQRFRSFLHNLASWKSSTKRRIDGIRTRATWVSCTGVTSRPQRPPTLGKIFTHVAREGPNIFLFIFHIWNLRMINGFFCYISP